MKNFRPLTNEEKKEVWTFEFARAYRKLSDDDWRGALIILKDFLFCLEIEPENVKREGKKLLQAIARAGHAADICFNPIFKDATDFIADALAELA